MLNNSKNRIREYFELLRQWSDLTPEDLEDIAKTGISIDILKILYSELYGDTSSSNDISLENVVKLIRELRGELKKYNQQLGTAMVTSYKLSENGEVEKSIEVLQYFISNCKSNYYREIAEYEISKLKK